MVQEERPPEKLDMISCILPALGGDGASKEVHVAAREIAGETLHKMKVYCGSDWTRLYSILAAVWSIVLFRFTELDRVCFEVNAVDDNTGFEEPKLRGKQIFVVGMTPNTVIRQLLRIEHHRKYSDNSRYLDFNTGIIIRHNNVGQESSNQRAVNEPVSSEIGSWSLWY